MTAVESPLSPAHVACLVLWQALPLWYSCAVTRCRELKGRTGVICSTDDFFIQNGQWVWHTDFSAHPVTSPHVIDLCWASGVVKCSTVQVCVWPVQVGGESWQEQEEGLAKLSHRLTTILLWLEKVVWESCSRSQTIVCGRKIWLHVLGCNSEVKPLGHCQLINCS